MIPLILMIVLFFLLLQFFIALTSVLTEFAFSKQTFLLILPRLELSHSLMSRDYCYQQYWYSIEKFFNVHLERTLYSYLKYINQGRVIEVQILGGWWFCFCSRFCFFIFHGSAFWVDWDFYHDHLLQKFFFHKRENYK